MIALNLVGHFDAADGYGSMTEHACLGLVRAGVDVNAVPLRLRMETLDPITRQVVIGSGPLNPDIPTLYFSWVRPDIELYRGRGLFAYTMWESDRLPISWVDALNHTDGVIVPSQYCAEVFRSNGVLTPLRVIPHGVDPDVYSPVARPDRETFTTLMVGTVEPRKHVDVGVRAWHEAFGDDMSARLIIKARNGEKGLHGFHAGDDERISVVSETEPTRGIMHWYQEADVLLALGSEGFGLPSIEALATGLPIVALNSEGQGDICRAIPELIEQVSPAEWEAATVPGRGVFGRRGRPSVHRVADALKNVRCDYSRWTDNARQASSWVLRNRDVRREGPAILDFLTEQRAFSTGHQS